MLYFHHLRNIRLETFEYSLLASLVVHNTVSLSRRLTIPRRDRMALLWLVPPVDACLQPC